ncbi:UNVERIFIED_ORG: hypothetical protein J2W65_002518 [Pseudomonas parafulva]|nr:hypothetical protein [Pseudomonas parafulva]
MKVIDSGRIIRLPLAQNYRNIATFVTVAGATHAATTSFP